jgi:molybdopterin-guanine dinucleotide biosynthesis protein A
MAGLLTAFQHEPEASFLIVGCDYPFVEKRDLDQLVSTYRERQTSVVYLNKETGFIEPLLSVYHNDIHHVLIRNFELFQHSLRRILEQEKAVILPHRVPARLVSIDDVEGYESASKGMRK